MAGMGTWGFKGAPIFGSTMAELIAPAGCPSSSHRSRSIGSG